MPHHDPFPADPRARVQRALEDVAAGKMVILVDDEDRENEGDLVMAAELVTPEAINFMATHGRGLICMPMTTELIQRLDLPMMVRDNGSPYGTAFTISIEASTGVTTGISAADRARTIEVAVSDDTRPEHIVSPGHVFPLRAQDGGVLVRAGQTEGSVDLARLAGLKPAGVICEIMNDDGTMARLPQLQVFAQEHGLSILTIADMIAWRLETETQVHVVAKTALSTDGMGDVDAYLYRNRVNDLQYLALVKGTPSPERPTLVRVTSSNVWSDALTAFRTDGGTLLGRALQALGAAEAGVLLYILRPFSPDGIFRAMGSVSDQIEGDMPAANRRADPYPTAFRDYGLGAQVLRDLGVGRIHLLSNSDRSIPGVEGYGLDIEERVPVPSTPDQARSELSVLEGGRS